MEEVEDFNNLIQILPLWSTGIVLVVTHFLVHIKIRKYKKNISKEIQTIIGARKRLLECRQMPKLVEERQ